MDTAVDTGIERKEHERDSNRFVKTGTMGRAKRKFVSGFNLVHLGRKMVRNAVP